MGELDRVSMATIDKDKESRWNLQAVWAKEKDDINKFIERQANLNMGRLRDKAKAKEFAGDVWTKIQQAFPFDDAIDPELLQLAKDGRLRAAAGSSTMITLFGIFRFFAMGLEVAVFAFMWIFGESSPVVIVQGVLLALSAYSLGWGLGEFFISLGRKDPHDVHPAWRTAAALIFGVVGVGVIIAVRVRYQEEEGAFAVVAISLILALVIALFEALYRSMSHNYDRWRHDEFRAQVMFSNEQHNSNEHTGGATWKKVYEDRVELIATRLPPLLEPPAEAP